MVRRAVVDGGGGGEPALRALLEAVRRSPGARKTDLLRRVGLPWGTLDYRLRLLERDGAVRLTRDGKFTRVWPAAYTPGLMQRCLPPENRLCADILRHLGRVPQASLGDLVRACGGHPRTVRRALRYLCGGAHVLPVLPAGRGRARYKAAKAFVGLDAARWPAPEHGEPLLEPYWPHRA